MEKKILEVNVDDLGFGGVYSLVTNVIKHNEGRFSIDIACIEPFVNPSNVKYLNSIGTKVEWVGSSGNKLIKQFVVFKKLSKYLKNNNYDCVHIHADLANKLLVSGLAAKKARVNSIILHSHASGVDGNHRKVKRIIHFLCKIWLPFIGTDFVACSEFAAKWMYTKNCKATIIKNGVDLNKFRLNKEIEEEERIKLNLDSEKIIGHVGRFAYVKNHTFMIEVLNELKIRNDSVKLLLVGEGPEEDNIREIVKREKLEDYVIFYGTTNHVDRLMQIMNVFILPSFSEGLPVVGIEAQAAGVPVIYSDRISKEAKAISETCFLPIEKKNVQVWADVIEKKMKEEKYDTYDKMKSAGFDIRDTTEAFLSLYK